MTLYLSNHYNTYIQVSIQFFDPNCDGDRYRVVGWWTIEPGATPGLTLGGLNDLRNHSFIYYYAEAWDGAVWTSDRFATATPPTEAVNRCSSVHNTGDRVLNYREQTLPDTVDFVLSFIPDINPIIDVRTEKHQLGGWINVKGHGFTPLSRVDLVLENLFGLSGPRTYDQSHAYTNVNGEFVTREVDARCRTNQCGHGPVTIRAIDTMTGESAVGLTGAYCCP